MADAVGGPARKLIYVLPRIRLSGTAFGQDSFEVSKARFLPDEQKSWYDTLKLPRPVWLDIYQDFPGVSGRSEASPARGTLVVSDDDEWLRAHIGRLLAIVYVMGIAENRWQVPADAFRFSSFWATDAPHDMVELHTKSGGKTEDLRSLKLLPPLELRGVSSTFRVALDDPRHVELISKFDQNPYERLGAACYHLFRSQFDDPFFAPPEQDAAAFCACLEAAFNIEGPDYPKSLIDCLQSLYGEHPKFARWIKGLYSERSVFNHGVAIDPTHTSSDDRQVAQAEYRERNLSWDVLRHLCLDVIGEQLQNSIDASKRELSRMMSPMRTMLRKFFYSEEIWHEVVKVFTQSKSVEKIRLLTGDEHDDFIELCCSYLNGHSWQAMKGKADGKKVLEALKAMAAIFGEFAKSANDNEGVTSASDLFQAADKGDTEAIDTWVRNHAAWEKQYAIGNIEEGARAVAVHTAKFFLERL